MSGRIVYSTDSGRMCPECGEPVAECRCSRAGTLPETDGIVRLRRQTKGRRGKPVVIISGLPLDNDAMKSLASRLKSTCGAGGAVEDRSIVIQGDKRALLKAELEALGYTVKVSGG